MNHSLIIENLSHSFGDKVALREVNLTIPHGEIHCLVGITGAGKSLLLKLIAGLVPVQSGVIHRSGDNVAFVFQSNPFLSWLTIGKNLELSTYKKLEEISDLLKKFNLSEFVEMYPKQLSGGTIQKFNLLRAFLMNAEIILMDEPFSHLDLVQKEELYTFSNQLWKETRPKVLLVTHDIHEALTLSEKIWFLSKTDHQIKYNLENSSDSHNSEERFQTIKGWLREDLC